ncbi:MAG: Ig-like domain-containing protein [Bacteroidaceae bacterium]|nr:Ig-like domain-containing protein [Bacteroidaceae bacterium]MBQ9500462.1 Ig-like domain-containing protein [Bacteroidaceae bacterium]
MKNKLKIWGKRTLLLIGSAVVLYSCASIGRLEGGEEDFDPPVMKESSPRLGSVNQKNTKRFTIEFDEYIKLDKPQEKIVFSPPQAQAPEIKASGKKVVVNLQDSLQPNTTYTIDFADAIQDNNEGNPLTQFTYTFSTGEQLDTLAVAGTVLNASNLEPIKGAVVGLYADLSDTVFQSKPFERMGRSDSRGYFSIRGIAPGKYHVFALQDDDRDYKFSQPTEQVAFSDSVIIPTSEPRMRQDTVWIDSLTIDTIVPVSYTYYMPDNIILRNFKQNRPNRRLAGFNREEAHKFKLNFTAPSDSMPVIKGLNFNADSAFVIELNNGVRDTLQYWLKDSTLIKMDTLLMSVSYLYTDSLYQLQPRTDTLRVTYRAKPPTEQERKAAEQAKKEEERRLKHGDTLEVKKPEIKPLPMEVYAPGTLDIYDYLSLTFQEPVQRLDTAAIHLEKMQADSTFAAIPFEFQQDSTDLKVYNIYADWEVDGNYKLRVDSAAVTGLYGLITNKTENAFKIKPLEEYGQLFYTVMGVDTTAFVELLDERDNVVRTVDLIDGHADFYYLNPGKYGARLVVDVNGNGRWDTGDYDLHLEPEMVYYYNQILELKANFDIYQNWDVHELPLDKQKPDDLKKQKPETTQNRRDRNASSQNNNRSSTSSSMRNQRSSMGF